jgi:hypothetical protein
MPIRRALESRSFGPEDIKVLEAAFEGALADLNLVDRDDALVNLVAKKVLALALEGERDPDRLRELTVRSLSGD